MTSPRHVTVVLVLVQRRAADRRLRPDVAGQPAPAAEHRHGVLPTRTTARRDRRLPGVT